MLRDSLGNPVVDSTQTQVWGVDYHKVPIYLMALVKEQDSLMNEMSNRLLVLESIVENCCDAEPSYRIGTTSEDSANESMATLLNVYPNPNDGNFTVDYRVKEGEAGSLYLLTVSGKKMLLSNDGLSFGKEDFNIIGPSGVYQVILENSDGKMLKNVKVVVAR